MRPRRSLPTELCAECAREVAPRLRNAVPSAPAGGTCGRCGRHRETRRYVSKAFLRRLRASLERMRRDPWYAYRGPSLVIRGRDVMPWTRGPSPKAGRWYAWTDDEPRRWVWAMSEKAALERLRTKLTHRTSSEKTRRRPRGASRATARGLGTAFEAAVDEIIRPYASALRHLGKAP